MTCRYTLTDADGKEITLQGVAEFKAYLVDGGLSHLFPDGNYPWVESKEAKPEEIGKGNSGKVYRIGNEVEKNSTNDEAKVYELLKGVEGIAQGYEKDGKIRLPYYKNIISTDTIESDNRKNMSSIFNKNIARINNAVSAFINTGYDYNEPYFQFGMNDDKSLDLLDFSNADNKEPERALQNGLSALARTYSTFGLERVGKAINQVNDVLFNQRTSIDDSGYLDFIGEEVDGVNYKTLNDALNGKKAEFAYYTTNARHVGIKNIAQTDNVDGVKVVLSTEPLSQKDIDTWELTPVYSGKAQSNQDSEVKAESTQEQEEEPNVDMTEPDAETETTSVDPANPIDAFNFIMQGLNEGTVSIDEYKKGFEDAIANKDAIESELSKKTKDDLVKSFGLYLHKNEKKDYLVHLAYKRILSDFFISDDLLTYGMGKDSYVNAIRNNVESLTQADLDSYAVKQKEAIAERKKEIEEALEGVKDPKTLDDFGRYMAVKVREEKMSFQEARMTLTPEQRAKYDELVANKNRSERNYRKERDADYVATNRAETDAEIIKTVHTRDGYDLWVVKAAERVERDIYNDWNATAKKLGGWYSSFKGRGATPGFQFKTEEGAKAFQQYISKGDTEAVQEQAKARRDAYQDDKTQSTVERLTEMADRLEESANESLNQVRKVNTARRAGMAANADAKSRSQIALAKTMRNIANAISSGKANFLDRVRQKVQVEFLQGMVSSAHYRQLMDETKGSYGEYEKRKYEEPTQVTADYAEFPSYSAYRSDLANLARQLVETEGTKQLGKDLLKIADDVSDAYLKFAKENLLRVGGFRTKDGGIAAFTSMKQAEASIAASGYNGKAIPFKVSAREIIPILSPSEAQVRGIWKGDNDKRITLDSAFGNKLITALGKANCKKQKVTVPWQFERAHSDISRLQKMGIESPAEFRAALREFIDLKEQPEQEDKIKKLERSMVGRANDGLDFFPTPQSVADEMIAAAEIKEGMKVLEPSAGMGHIADQIRDAGVDPDVIELSPNRRELLEAKGHNIVANDFMDYNEGGYDRIIMNPPFSDRRDAAHVQHAYDLLKPGGRLVAIMGEGVFFGSDKKASSFMDWLDSVGGEHEKMPENTFMDKSLPVTTGVNTRMVVIDKPISGEATDSDGLKYSKPVSVTKPYNKDSLTKALEKELDAEYGQGWFNRLLATDKFKVINRDEAVKLVGDNALFHKVWHGSVADFDKFDLSKTGSSNGIEFGWGIYTSDTKSVAEMYHEPRMGGKLFELNIKNHENEYLDWDKSLGEQSDYVISILKDNDLYNESFTGEDLYDELRDEHGGSQAASEYLKSIGIKGNSYIDGVGGRSRTYVIFDDTSIDIEAKYSKTNGAQAFYNPANDISYFIADNIGKDDDLKGLMLHEIGVHALQLGKNDAKFQAILKQLDALKDKNAKVKAAYERIPKDTKAEHRLEELAAYIVQNEPSLSVLKRIIAWFKNALRNIAKYVKGADRAALIKWANSIDENDVIYMANTALKSAPDSLAFSNVERKGDGILKSGNVANTIDVDGVQRPTVNSEGKPIHSTDEGIRNFWKWFGDSKVVDEEGRPLVVYHGTKSDINIFDIDAPRNIAIFKDAQGFYFTKRKDDASVYAGTKDGSNIIPVYLKIINPLAIEDGDFSHTYISPKKLQNYEESGNDGMVFRDGDEMVAFHPNQIKSVLGNDGSFNQDNNDIRYSMESEDNALWPDEPKTENEWIDAVKTKLENLTDRAKVAAYGAFTVRQLSTLGKNIMPQLKGFSSLLQKRESLQNRYKNESGRLVDNHWKKLDSKNAYRINTVINESTLYDIDSSREWTGIEKQDDVYVAYTQNIYSGPDQEKIKKRAASLGGKLVGKTKAEFTSQKQAAIFISALRDYKPTLSDQERQKQHKLNYARFQSLPKDAQYIYRDAYRQHDDLFNAKMAALEKRISKAIFDEKKRSQFIATVRQQFESNRMNWYYAPLSRFGDYWLYGKVDGQPYFETFESESALNRAKESFQGDLIGSGRKIEDMKDNEFDSVGEGFIANIQSMLQEAEAPEELQDQVYQMFLETLPSVSMRKNSIHRQGIAGFDKDAMRAFSNSLWHGSKQLSNLMYNNEMSRLLSDAKKAIDVASSRSQVKQIENEIEAAQKLLDDWANYPLVALKNDLDNDPGDKVIESMISLRKKYETLDEKDRVKRLKSIIKKHNELIESADKIRSQDNGPIQASKLVSEMNKAFEDMQKSDYSPLVQTAMQFNFVTMLGLSPAFFLVNTIQTPAVAMPRAFGRFGNLPKVMKIYGDSLADFMDAVVNRRKDEYGNWSLTATLKDKLAKAEQKGDKTTANRLRQEISAMDKFLKEGDVDKTQGYDLIGVAEEGAAHGGIMLKVSQASGFLAHHSERMNREITLLSNFRLAREHGESFRSAINAARELNIDSHLDYSSENTARFMRSPSLKLITQFMKYKQGMYFLWFNSIHEAFKGASEADKKEGMRTAIGLVTMQTALAGTMGLPLMGALMTTLDLIGGMFDDDDDKWDTKKEIRLGLHKVLSPLGELGDKLAESITMGVVNGFTPVELHSRLDLSDVIFRDPIKEMEGRDAGAYLVAGLFGPTGGNVMDLYESVRLANDGLWARAIETMPFMPKFGADFLKAIRYGTEDARTQNDKLLKEMSKPEVILQALGLSSSNLSRKYDENSYIKNSERDITEARNKIIEKIAEGRIKGDMQLVAEGQREAQEWRTKHPEYPVTAKSIKASIRARRRAEKNMQGTGIRVNPRLDYLRDENKIEG
jgi:hypothetical protein